MPVRIHREIIKKIASHELEFIDITDDVQEIVTRAGVSEGMVLVYSRHTTAAIKINENEPLLLGDMARFLRRMAPKDGDYKHNDFVVRTENMTAEECPNGHSHCQNLLLGASETIPIGEGELLLGRWQRIFLIELDRRRAREVVVQIQGW